MGGFDHLFWNLAQAAVWVVYREKDLVDQMANADRDSYAAIGMYPSMWPKDRRRQANVNELYNALLTRVGLHEFREYFGTGCTKSLKG